MPSSDVDAPTPHPAHPPTAALSMEGPQDSSSSNQSHFDSVQSSDTPWSFPNHFPPTFESHDFAAAQADTTQDDATDVQLANDPGIGAQDDRTMTPGHGGHEVSSPSKVSAAGHWDLAGFRLSMEDAEVPCDDDDPKAVGRVSDANLAIIKEEFLEVQKRAKEVAKKTGLSHGQVLQHWSTGGGRTHTKLNAWNLYSAYFRDHEKQELSRLPER